MSEHYTPTPQLTDERFIRITKPVEIWDACVAHWRPLSAEDLPPLTQLALTKREDFDPELAQSYCKKHNHFFFIAGQCPDHLYQAQPGDELSLPYHAACALIARQEAEGMSLPELAKMDPKTGHYPDNYWDGLKANMKSYSEKAGLGGEKWITDHYLEL